MMLTERQKKDLNSAILEYMMQGGSQFSSSIEAFSREANVVDTSDFGKNILEKKWTSIVRMQKRIMELETQVTDLQKKVSLAPDPGTGGDNSMPMQMHMQGGLSVPAPGGGAGAGGSSLIPRGPARSSLSGHR